MSNFRTKLLGLAVFASACAGVSYGQVVSGCTSPNPALNVVIRSESSTELVSDPSVVTCANTVATTATVTLTLSAPATSKAFSPGGAIPGNSEAALFVYPGAVPAPGTAPAGPGAGATSGPYWGTISTSNPNVITFTGVALPAPVAPATFSLGFSNIRVNAVGASANQVTATPAIIYSAGAVASSVSGLTGENVAFIQPSLAPVALSPLSATSPATVTNYTVCGGGSFLTAAAPAGSAAGATSASFIIKITELFTGAFKTQGGVVANAGENGSYVPGGASNVGLASSSDQIVITIGNLPTSGTIYVPQTLTTSAGTTLTLLNSTAVTSPAGLSLTPNPAAPLANQAPYVAFTPSNGGVTITYTVSGISSGAAAFLVPTYLTFAPNSTPAQGAVTIGESYGPTGTVTGPAAGVPTFAAASSTISGSSILLCQTTLLFPFVTNQLGFDTGVVLANTSVDASGVGGKSSVTAQNGSCTLSFFGNGAPTPATGVADPGGALAAGTTHAFTLSAGVAPGFQGYMIANCPMLYIHGFAFISYNIIQNNGIAEGYLAEVLARGGAGDAVTF